MDVRWGQLLEGILLVQDGRRTPPELAPPHTVSGKRTVEN